MLSYSALSEFDGVFIFLRTRANLEGDFLICLESKKPGSASLSQKEILISVFFLEGRDLGKELELVWEVIKKKLVFWAWETKCFLHQL